MDTRAGEQRVTVRLSGNLWTRLTERGVSNTTMRYILDLYSLDEDQRSMHAEQFVQFGVAVEAFVKQDDKFRAMLNLLDVNRDCDSMVVHLVTTCKRFSDVFHFIGPNARSRFLKHVEKQSYFAHELTFLGPNARSQFLQDWAQDLHYNTGEIVNYVFDYMDWDCAKQTRRTKACKWRKIHHLDDMFSPKNTAFNIEMRKAVQVGEIIMHLLQKYAKHEVAPCKQELAVIPESREIKY